jgi:hypothetical protein
LFCIGVKLGLSHIKMDLKEIGCEDVDWIYLAQDRGQWRAIEHSNQPSGSIKGGEFLDHLSDFWHLRTLLHGLVIKAYTMFSTEFN